MAPSKRHPVSNKDPLLYAFCGIRSNDMNLIDDDLDSFSFIMNSSTPFEGPVGNSDFFWPIFVFLGLKWTQLAPVTVPE